MVEDPLARSIRRGLSQQLTQRINDTTNYPKIRIKVLHSLALMWQRLESLKGALRDELGLHEAQPLFYFYLKGGNAYSCTIDPDSAAATIQGGGDSDWDTQVVVDPWAPLPIQDMIYAAIEDLIRDELRNCSLQIGSLEPDLQSPADLEFRGTRLVYRYQLVVDEPQTIRQVLDYDQNGLWVDTRRKISDQTIKGALAGLLFNDAIKPFQLIRLGFTWHSSPLDWPQPVTAGQATGPAIDRPVLMELLDVTLPRRNTVEAVELWESLSSRQMAVIATNVSVLDSGAISTEVLPLPSLFYHFHEQALMLCEVAAGVSKSVDKVARRFKRLREIYNSAAIKPSLQVEYQDHLAAMAGVSVAQITQRTFGSQVVDTVLAANGASDVLQAPQGTLDFMAVNMMYQVANRQLAYDGNACYLASISLNDLITRLHQRFALSEAAASDDLAVYTAVVKNGYFNTNLFPATGINPSTFLRLNDPRELDDAAKFLEACLPDWLAEEAAARASNEPREVDPSMVQTIRRQIRVVRRDHVTFRQTGTSQERTLVAFRRDRAVACISLTSAVASEAPFLPDPYIAGRLTASVIDLAEQRKVAAAVIDDFCIRQALARQLFLIQRLFVHN